MSPASSASGRNCPGSSSPRSGCSHRASTSKPTTWPPARSTIGWKYGTISPRSRPRRSSVEMRSPSTTTGREPAANAAMRSRPPALAPYMAASASRRRSSAREPSTAFTAKPMLAVMISSWPANVIGRCTERRIRSATSAGSMLSSRTTTNSSPPKRAMRPPSGMAAGQAGRDLLQHTIAHRVAEAVVDHLEVVEVDEQHRDLAGHRRGEQVVEHRHQRRTVGEVGEIVVGGGVGQSLGRAPLIGDVLDVRDRQRHAVVLGHRHASARPDELAVAAEVPLIEEVRLGDAEFQSGTLRRRRPQIVWMGDLADADAEQRLDRAPEHVGQRLVGIDDPAVVQAHERHAGRRRVERLLEAPARLLQRDRTPLPIARRRAG